MFVLAVVSPVNAQEEKGGSFYDFGVFDYEDQDFKSAEKNFLKALELEPDNPFYLHFLGKTYLKMERFDDAENLFTRAEQLDPDMPGLKYDTAFMYYKMLDYDKAATLFAEIVTGDPSNVPATYHGAMSYYKLGRYQQAQDYFIAAAEMSPNIKDKGYFYAGICASHMGKLKEAGEKFEYVRDNTDSDQLRKNAVEWLAAIERQKAAAKPYRLYLKVGYQYDDNVVLEPVDQDIATDQDDYAVVAFFTGSYNIVNQSDFKLGLGYNHYQTWYEDLTQLDFRGSTGNFYAKYSTGPVTLGLSYLPTYYWLNDESYLMRHHIRPDIVWNPVQDLSLRAAYSYYRNNYFLNDGRDGHTNEVSLDAYYSILNGKGLLSVGGLYEDNTASHPDYYYTQGKIRVALNFRIFWELDLNLSGNYHKREYDNVDSTFGITREDDRYYGAVSLGRSVFWKWLSITAEYNYTKNDSNISFFEYERNVTTLSLTAKY
jgi:tetratricopeptide (TPR) repeat protein